MCEGPRAGESPAGPGNGKTLISVTALEEGGEKRNRERQGLGFTPAQQRSEGVRAAFRKHLLAGGSKSGNTWSLEIVGECCNNPGKWKGELELWCNTEDRRRDTLGVFRRPRG